MLLEGEDDNTYDEEESNSLLLDDKDDDDVRRGLLEEKEILLPICLVVAGGDDDNNDRGFGDESNDDVVDTSISRFNPLLLTTAAARLSLPNRDSGGDDLHIFSVLLLIVGLDDRSFLGLVEKVWMI